MGSFELVWRCSPRICFLTLLHPDSRQEAGKCSPFNLETSTTTVSHQGCSCSCRKSGRSMTHSEAQSMKEAALNQISDLLANVPLTHIILDCSAWTFIDMVGANTLKSVN